MPRMTEWVVKIACTIAFRNAYRIFVADLKRREKLGDLNKHRQDNDFTMCLTETECVDVGWIHLLRGRVLKWDLVNKIIKKTLGLQKKYEISWQAK